MHPARDDFGINVVLIRNTARGQFGPVDYPLARLAGQVFVSQWLGHRAFSMY
jgi:hypothetical protein